MKNKIYICKCCNNRYHSEYGADMCNLRCKQKIERKNKKIKEKLKDIDDIYNKAQKALENINRIVELNKKEDNIKCLYIL